MIEYVFWICVALVIYSYFGFPIILQLLVMIKERFFPSHKLSSEEVNIWPMVTLLISAYNEEKVIAEKINNCLELDYPEDKFEILITSDGSDDRTPEIVKQFEHQGVRLLHQPERRGKMAAINRAMPETRGEIVVFSDANNMYDPGAIRHLVAPFQDPKVGGTNGAKYIIEGDGALGEAEGLYWRYESQIKKLETRLVSSTAVAGEIFAIRRELFERPPDNIINDDFYMAMRLIKRGYNIHYAHQAKSFERVSPTAQDEVKRRARINAGRYQAVFASGQLLPFSRPLITWQVVSHKYFRLLVPFAMLGALFSNLILVVAHNRLETSVYMTAQVAAWLLFFQVLFYLSALVYPFIPKKTFFANVLYLPTFLINSNFASLIGALRFLSNQQSTKWERVSRRD